MSGFHYLLLIILFIVIFIIYLFDVVGTLK
jgi:hypothetical protein